jgi:eukaryotic-like serine/threonine-protein kinase
MTLTYRSGTRASGDQPGQRDIDDLEEAIGVCEGDVLAGKYRIGRVLGAGSTGVVVAAHHVQLDTRVAIKFLVSSVLEDREALRRFAREAQAAAKITGEHVARVLDVGTLENDAPYMVMEFLDGVDLAHWLDTQGPLPIEQAVDFLLQACIAVAEAHGKGIVHRDLKPSNLFCIRRADGQPMIKVLDFGISKYEGAGAVGSDDPQATTGNAIIGSPRYMSPEQLKSSRDVDLRTDIWALGVILFELLTLNVPFQGETLPEICTQITLGEPASLRSIRPDVPAGLVAIIRKCLEKTPEKRFQDVAELAKALLEFGSPNARPLVVRISRIVQNDPLDLADASSRPKKRGRLTRIAIAFVALGVAVTVGLTGWFARRRPPRVVASQATSAQPTKPAGAQPTSDPKTADRRMPSEPLPSASSAPRNVPSPSSSRFHGVTSRAPSETANPELPPSSVRPGIVLDREDPWAR